MPKLKYLVSGNHEGISEHLGRVTVAAALRTARQLVQEGYIDVRICTPRGQVLSSDDFSHLEKQKGDRHGQRPVTRQPRSQEAQERKDQGHRRSTKPESGGLAAELHAREEEIALDGSVNLSTIGFPEVIAQPMGVLAFVRFHG